MWHASLVIHISDLNEAQHDLLARFSCPLFMWYRKLFQKLKTLLVTKKDDQKLKTACSDVETTPLSKHPAAFQYSRTPACTLLDALPTYCISAGNSTRLLH
jgi:hypothetical protein